MSALCADFMSSKQVGRHPDSIEEGRTGQPVVRQKTLRAILFWGKKQLCKIRFRFEKRINFFQKQQVRDLRLPFGITFFLDRPFFQLARTFAAGFFFKPVFAQIFGDPFLIDAPINSHSSLREALNQQARDQNQQECSLKKFHFGANLRRFLVTGWVIFDSKRQRGSFFQKNKTRPAKKANRVLKKKFLNWLNSSAPRHQGGSNRA